MSIACKLRSVVKAWMLQHLYENNLGQRGTVHSLYTESPLDAQFIENFSSLDQELRPPSTNFTVTQEELDKELCFLGVGECSFESQFYFTKKLSPSVLKHLLEVQPHSTDCIVLSEKYRKGLYRRTTERKGVITKEFSGREAAKVFFSRGHEFIKNGPYKSFFIDSRRDEAHNYYSYSYKKIPGNLRLYDHVFNETFDAQDIYKKYVAVICSIWPFVHLDLHGDNLVYEKFDDVSTWYVVDFESICKMDLHLAYRLYHGLFVQLIGHRDLSQLDQVAFLSEEEFERALKVNT